MKQEPVNRSPTNDKRQTIKPDQRLVRWAAIAGVVGPLILGSALILLTLVQWDFLRSLGWNPISAPTTDWPSGLALGPYGAWMSAAFVGCGLLLMFFAQGLRQAIRTDRIGRWGVVLLTFAGAAMIGLVSPTDPTFGGRPPTVAGRLHDLAFVVLGLSFWPALLLLGWNFGSDPRWKKLAPFTWFVAALILPAFALKGLLFYLFLLAIMVWCAVVALRLWQLSSEHKQ